jgi:hypothetical protein
MRIQPVQLAANGLADTPLDTVPLRRLPESARRRETDVWTIRLWLPHAECREQRAGKAAALVVHPAEILGSQQTDTFRKT